MATRKRAITKVKIPKGSSEEAKLGIEKLLSSGLTLDDAKELGIEIMSGFKTGQLHKTFAAKASLRISYLNLLGEPLTPRPKWPPFYRIRYLEDVEDPNSFAGQTEKKKLRYVNEPEAGVAAYLPHINGIDWFKMAGDADEPLIITEGELKAAKATKEGFPTIGLGGVFLHLAAELNFSELFREAIGGFSIDAVAGRQYRAMTKVGLSPGGEA